MFNARNVFFFTYLIEQIWPVETVLEADYAIFDAESLNYIFLDLHGSRGSKTQNWYCRKPLLELVKMQVILPKILAPMAYAMYLVYHEARNLPLLIKII